MVKKSKWLKVGDKLTIQDRCFGHELPHVRVVAVTGVRRYQRKHVLTLENRASKVEHWLEDGQLRDSGSAHADVRVHTGKDDVLIAQVAEARRVISALAQGGSALLVFTVAELQDMATRLESAKTGKVG